MEAINFVFLSVEEHDFLLEICTDVLVLQMLRMLLRISTTFQEKQKSAVFFLYLSKIHFSNRSMVSRLTIVLMFSLLLFWVATQHAAEHDRVTNDSKMLQTQQNLLVYNTNLTIVGHSSIDFEVIACSFLSVHQIQC